MASKSIQRSMAELKKQGYTCHVVERFNSFAKVRQDFGGFADILAYKEGNNGVLAVQACVGKGDVQKHVDKLTPLANVAAWLKSGNRLEIWSWAKRGARGERKLWTVKVTPFLFRPKEDELSQEDPAPVFGQMHLDLSEPITAGLAETVPF